ncbi:MAG TPA: CHAT domain-containing protein [Anaerolineae bacterium]|nr:CHAT domain-containing protein [Anaerolineae bacterium]
MSECVNLDLSVHGHQVSGYLVEAKGPADERASGPFDAARLAGLAADLEAIRAREADRAILERVGLGLFDALFPRNVLRLYDRLRPQPGEDSRLRLRLHFPARLAILPWELLYDQSHYLSFDPRCPIVRFLDLPDTPAPLGTAPPLRLLHLIASPVDAGELQVEKEASLLDSALGKLVRHGLVEIIPGQPGTLETLRSALRKGAHILHFSGHGAFDHGQGYLLFEDNAGLCEAIDAHTLAHLLQGSQVRLAVLNACESSRADDSDAFASVAASLVQAGLPAVIAHQFPMPDASAIAFAAEFHRALADGLPADAAVCEGRRAILSELGQARWDRMDWAAPVLTMQSPDGQILAVAQESGTRESIGLPMIQNSTTVNVESISGGVVNIGAIGIQAVTSAQPGNGRITTEYQRESSPSSVGRAGTEPEDRLPTLLRELGQRIQVFAPKEKQSMARDQVASLERALTGDRLDSKALAETWNWFQRELPSLTGAALSIIREAKPLAEREGETTLDEFLLHFGDA